MALDLSALVTEVSRKTDVDTSVVALVQTLAATVESLKGDPVQLQQLVDAMRTSTDTVAGAVSVNTPAAQMSRLAKAIKR
jgi:uncharacterized protein YabN with tetrapyrrole methylase and pyrophosphatase domain